MILMFSVIYRRRATEDLPAVPTAIFVIGRLVIWTLYSVGTALAQVGLHAAALLSPAMAPTSPLLAGGLLVAAGVFQWTPLKRACLAVCRSPLATGADRTTPTRLRLRSGPAVRRLASCRTSRSFPEFPPSNPRTSPGLLAAAAVTLSHHEPTRRAGIDTLGTTRVRRASEREGRRRPAAL
jgi:hypothetical protein